MLATFSAATRSATRRGLVLPRLASRARIPQTVCQPAWRTLSTQSGAASSATADNENIVFPLRHLVDGMPPAMRQAYGRQNMSGAELKQLSMQETMRKWEQAPNDTGSGRVQVALFTNRILRMSSHMTRHHKDTYTKRRLQMLVLQRNRMLKYLRREQRDAYNDVITGLAIRPNKNFDPTITPKKATRAVTKKKHRRPHKARPYGDEKRPKGKVQLRKHATRQRRLQRKRDDVAKKAEKAAESGEA